VEVVIEGMAALFDEVLVVVPDTIVEHTYRALGYPEAQVVAKARGTSRNLQNRCQRAIELARERHPATRLRLLDWATEVEGHPGHDTDVEEMRSLFRMHPAFRAAVIKKGGEVLAARRSDRPPTEAEIEEGVQYLLKEFAFVRRARRQLGRDLIIPYYQDFPLAQGLCDGQFLPAEDGVGWLIYVVKLEGAAGVEDGQHDR
jgi:cyclo(L-tyrosyl-L-tyrosyl) synthase